MVRLALTWKGSPWVHELRPGLSKLGRNPTNDFRISAPSVSSFHAEVQVEGDSVKVRDLGSTNGTFINGQPVTEADLVPGDTLRLGDVELSLEQVLVSPRQVAAGNTEQIARAAAAELAKPCALHTGLPAIYHCENCGGYFCESCVKIIGHDRHNSVTVCPVCSGQCNFLGRKQDTPKKSGSLLAKLTQTLKIPFPKT